MYERNTARRSSDHRRLELNLPPQKDHFSSTGSNGLRQEEIAEQLDVGKAAVSRAVDSLETKGYVRRERHPEDRRAYSICLTEQAYAVQKEIIGIYERLYQRVSMVIPDEELELVEQLLDKVAVNLQSWRNN